MSALHGVGRLLVIIGVALVLVGLVAMALPRLPWLGRLPGDILVQRRHLTFFFPLGTCLLLSFSASLALWIAGQFFRR